MSGSVGGELGSGVFEELNYLIPGNAWKVVEKFIDGLTVLQVIGQILDRHTRPGKNRGPAQDSRIGHDEGRFHGMNASRMLWLGNA